MNIMVISTGSGLFKPATGDRSRFFNLAVQLAKRNKITVLQPLKAKDIRDPSLGKVVYFKTYIFGKSFGVFTDINPDFVIKFLKIITGDEIDIIQVSHPSGIVASKWISRLIRRNVPVVYDAHNVDSDSIQYSRYFLKSSTVPFTKKILTKLIMFLVPIIEMVAIKCADYIIAVSEDDRTRFIQKYGIDHDKITVIPSGVNIQHFLSQKELNKFPDIRQGNEFLILFHGSFNAPNVEAIDLIRNYIAPRCATTIEEAMFIIAGTEGSVFEEHNIKSAGFVEDIYSLIQAVDIALVPIRGGGGTRLKILDYMGAGLPIVTTKKGIEGINAKNGEHAIIVDDVNEEFIDAIKYLIDNEQERKRIGANARRLAEEEYDWDKIGEKLNGLYSNLMEEDKRRKLNDQKYNRIKTKIRRIH